MKRSFKIILSFILVICLCVIPCITQCFAGNYTYTIKILAGNQGSFGGSDSLTYKNLKYGSVVDISNAISTVKLSSDKYYVKGIRLSGHDNSELKSPAVTVTKDEVYVIAYGIKGDMVNYTVRFQDAAGNQLAAAVTGSGQIGDKPVVAFKYIDGYSPNAYNLTKTLSANENDNVFTFTYSKVEVQNTVTTIVVNNPVNNPVNNNNNNTQPAAQENENNQATGVEELEEPVVQAEVTEPVEDTNVTEDTGTQTTPATQELIDLDEPNVALAENPDENTGDTEEENNRRLSPWLIIAFVVLFLLIALVIYYFVSKNEEDDETDVI